MPSDPAATLTSLLRQSTIDDHEEVLKAANASLKASKNDLDTQHTRIVALLKLDRFDDALRSIAEGGATLDDACKLERSYALYKTGKLDEAAQIATSSTSARSFSHVAAQVAYRAERFDDARRIYDALSADQAAAVGEESDLVINTLATAAQEEWKVACDPSAGNPRASPAESPETFELAYNIACGSVARGELSKALSLLQRAARLCDAADDLSDEEKQMEMVPIWVQQAYVYSRLGKTEDALRLHKQLASYDLGDDDTKLVAGNNFTALRDDGLNAFETQREIQSASEDAADAKLFRHQESRLRCNRLALALRAQKFPGVVRETKRLLADPSKLPPSDAYALSVINVAARSLRHSTSVSLPDVLPEVGERPTDVGVVLTAVQLHALANNLDAATSLLENLFQKLEEQGSTAVRFSPGLVALAVSLYKQQGRLGCTRTELSKASSYWNDNRHAGRQATSLLRGAGAELLKSSDAADRAIAGAAFEKLCAQPSLAHDSIASAGLIASFSKSDPAKIESHLSDLPPLERLVSGVDIQALLNDGVVAAAQPALVARGKKRAAEDEAAARQQQQKKRRRRKLPKNYEEGKKPDPERWLPLRDRTSYRPRGGKKGGKKKGGGGGGNDNTQGGFVKEEETLELAGGAGSVKVEKAPAQSSSNNKKKKKGGKK